MAVDEKQILEKAARGEKLTKEEEREIMSTPNDFGDNAIPSDDDSDEELEFEDVPEDKEDKDKADTSADKTDDEKEEETSDSDKKDEKPDKADTGEEKPGDEKDKKPDVEPEGSIVDRVNAELDKPDGQENLEGFSDKEKGLFYEMRRARKRAQKAEEDRDAERFARIKERKEAEARQKKIEANQKSRQELQELLAGDDEEYISKGDLRKVLEKTLDKPVEEGAPEDQAEGRKISDKEAEAIVVAQDRYKAATEKEAKFEIRQKALAGETVYDIMAVCDDFIDEIITGNEKHQKELAKIYMTGEGNMMLRAYEIITNDPRFPKDDPKYKYKGEAGKKKEPEKKEPEKSEAEKTNAKINKNEGKVKTSGNQGGGGALTDEKTGETYTMQRLASMSSSEFKQVPKNIRDKFLKEF